MDDIIRDVFIDYTRNYMTPEDVITGTGPYKWSFGSSIFFSWTAITTIGAFYQSLCRSCDRFASFKINISIFFPSPAEVFRRISWSTIR